MKASLRRPSPGPSARPLCTFGALLLLAGTAFAFTPELTPEQRNFDARRQLQAEGLQLQASAIQLHALATLELEVEDLAVTMNEVTGATRSLYNRTGYLTQAADGNAESIARSYLQSHRAALGLLPSDLEGMEISSLVPSNATGASRLYLSQVYEGLPVYGAQLHVNVNRDGRIMSVNNGFLPNLAGAAPSPEPSITAAEAVAVARDFLGMSSATDLSLWSDRLRGDTGGTERIAGAQLMWLPVRAGEARLVWSFVLATAGEDHMLEITVDAHSGQLMTSFDRVSNATYDVYALPVESPEHTTPLPPSDARTQVVNPADSTASPLGWHDTGTTAYTIMRGNNTHAYDDIDADGSPPATEPDCGTSLDCSFSIDLSAEPSAYTSAAVANVFYLTNTIHDVQYYYGFDEASGNFQVNNFGRGGADSDDVRAEVQDGNKTCDAGFGVSPDGNRPRMQMYLCGRTSPTRDGDLDAGVVLHEYGHGISKRLVGGPSTVGCLNNDQEGGEGWSDFMGLWYTMEVGDQGTDSRGIGAYLIGQDSSGKGVRSKPYSTDPAINDFTYESIDGKAVPHGVGSVWAQALWEVTWALVDEHGFDPDLFDVNAGAGNHRAMLYVTEGMKNTACSPTFVDARDGILQAAADNFSGEDVCRIWSAFAAFGLGEDAVSGGADSTTPTNGFSIPDSCITYQAGSVTQDENLRTQALSGFTNPRVVMGPLSYNGVDPATIRVKSVSSTSFSHYTQEWDYLNGTHNNETVGYLAVEDGASTLGSLAVEAGSLTLDHNWKTVTFATPFASVPVILPQVVTFNGSSAVTVRLNNVSATGFDLLLQEEEANSGGGHNDETVHWVAIERGTTTVGSSTILVGRTSYSVTDAWSTINFGQTLSNPVFVAANQSWRGVDPCTPRYQGLSSTGVQVKIQEEQSGDSETAHVNAERIGYVVISQ